MSDVIRITFMGDTMPGGVLHYETENNFCGTELLNILNGANIRVATLETAIGDEPLFDEEKMKREKDVIHCPVKNLYRLTTLGVNVVSLANNHAWDLGWLGIEKVMQELDKRGIKYCGAGKNLQDASEPAVVSAGGKTLAFIAYCDNQPGTCGYIPVATANSPGINAMIDSNIQSNIVRLKRKYDYLFVLMHWGKEYYYYPTPEVNRLARKMIDWGVDGVIGSHSHQIQPTVTYRQRPIVFSLGNFFFPDRLITYPRSTYYPPEKPVMHQLPKTLGYPMVKEPTYKIWKDVARKGQVVTFVIDTKTANTEIHTDRVLTYMDADSHIDCYKGGHLPMMFRLSYIIVKMPFYGLLFFCMRGCRFIKKKIKREL